MAAMNPPWARRVDATMGVVSALAPAIVAAMLVGNEAPAAHDGGVARVLGLKAEPWRATDALFDSLFICIPLGTRAARAELAGAIVAGIASAVLYRMACALLAARGRAGGLSFCVATIAALTATLARPWQSEAAAVAGSVSGALLILTPIAILATSDGLGPRRPTSWPAAAFTVALALGHEPCVGACALAGCAAFVGASAPIRRSLHLALAQNATRGSIVVAAGAGLAPWSIAVMRVRAAGGSLTRLLSVAWAGESGASLPGSPLQYLRSDVGPIVAALALGGLAFAVRTPRARPLAAALAAITVVGLCCAWAGAPVGPTRFGAPLLAASGCAAVLGGVTLDAVVTAVAAARVPLSGVSAALVALLEFVLPVDAADDSLSTSAAALSGYASGVWNDVAWGTLPPGSVALITNPTIVDRAVAARAQGEIRADVVLAPLCPGCPPPWPAFAQDPALVAVWRDVALTGAPTEASLSAAAAGRTIVLTYEPSWGSAAARHLVPFSLFDRFSPEPRGASDRRRALDGFTPYQRRLAALTASDPELAQASASLLRPRALLLATQTDRALGERAASDLAPFERRAGMGGL